MHRGIPESDLFSESIYFRSCCSITGAVRDLHSCRRNGYPMLVFPADVAEPDPEPDEGELAELVEELSYNLNPLERRTWLKLMDGQPVEHIAADEGVTRTAIYERIRGNSKAWGGMVKKNDYVRHWWERRREDQPKP